MCAGEGARDERRSTQIKSVMARFRVAVCYFLVDVIARRPRDASDTARLMAAPPSLADAAG